MGVSPSRAALNGFTHLRTIFRAITIWAELEDSRAIRRQFLHFADLFGKVSTAAAALLLRLEKDPLGGNHSIAWLHLNLKYSVGSNLSLKCIGPASTEFLVSDSPHPTTV
jgi:hypothetical protein